MTSVATHDPLSAFTNLNTSANRATTTNNHIHRHSILATSPSTSSTTTTTKDNKTPGSPSQSPPFTTAQYAGFDDYTPLDFANLEDLTPEQIEDLNALAVDYLSKNTMQSDSWGSMAQFAPQKMGRFSHQRESSLSSMGSNGPASPFNQNTSNPQIAVTDSSNDGLADMMAHDPAGNANSFYQLTKTMGTFPGYQSLDNSMPEMAYPLTIPGPNGKPRQDRGLLPAPDFSAGSTRSNANSVASSIAGGDSPATPMAGDMESVEKRRKGAAFSSMPKLDRTMTDVFNDELYNPNFTITSSASPSSQAQAVVSPPNDVFSQRINAANSQHLSSPLAFAQSNDFGATGRQGMQFGAAQQRDRLQPGAQLFQHQGHGVSEPETPKTISPKDAVLEFSEPDSDANFPLFPQPDTTGFDMDHFTKTALGHQNPNALLNTGASPLNYMPSQLGTSIKVPQQYPFIARPQPSHETPPRLSSAGSSSGDSMNGTPIHRGRPMSTAAESGTYTCTYHGCTLRFDTPALLQKHKREGHRQAQGVGQRTQEIVTPSGAVLNTQAGPHRCDRINPSTGKPCSTVFSRPYDLTRHEDTIHNARKQKVRCNLCTEDKTFSRADALTRHYRVCHPDVELPGKHRRRGGA